MVKPAADYWDETSFDEFGLPPGGLFLPLKETSRAFEVTQGRVRQWRSEIWWQSRFETTEGFNVIAILFARWRHARANYHDPFDMVRFELPDNWKEKGVFA